LTESPSRRQFSTILARPDPSVDLAEASLLIACEEYPELDVPGYLAQLDVMAAALRPRVDPSEAPEAAVRALNQYLFEEQGFRGNVEEYYDPRNSYLNQVLDRRCGIPITLSTVYMEVARRAGIAIDGVGLPGHFIVRVARSGPPMLVDPFHGGALLSEEDCQRRLDRIYGGRVKMEARMLAACSRKEILRRMLRNLKAIYLKEHDFTKALGIVELLLRVPPASAEDLRDRGIVHAGLDCYGLAVEDFEAYMARSPEAPEAAEILAKIVDLRRLAARVH
jgi:regulator of sirC expression with transglutaminase-like and TPR domain